MVAKKKKNRFKYRLVFIIPCCLLILTTITITVGSYWIQIAEKYKEIDTLDQQLLTLKELEEELKVDVEKLEDPDYVARYAREKFMYSKDGEIILRLPEE